MTCSKPIPIDPKLASLLEQAKNHIMTPEETIAQRRSWVRGEMGIAHPELTAEQIDQMLDRAMPETATIAAIRALKEKQP